MKPNHFKDLEQYDYSNNKYYLENSKLYLELRLIILTFKSHYVRSVVSKKNASLKQWIYDSTPLLQDVKYTWSTRCYWIMFGIYNFPKCYFDDCDVVFDGNVKFSIGYPICCKNCNNRKDSPRTLHTRETNYKNFGSYTNMGTELFKKQAIEGFLRNYGETNNMKSEKGLKEYQDAIEKEYGVRNLFQLDRVMENAIIAKKEYWLNVIRQNISKNQHIAPLFDIMKCEDLKVGKYGWWQCLDCGHVFYGQIVSISKEYMVECPFCKFEDEYEKHKRNHSHAEYEIVDFIRKNYPNLKVLHNTKQNRKIIPPKEIDIYLPELKIGIEYDGCYWHKIKDDWTKEYQTILKKTLLCELKNIHLIHIYDDEWMYARETIEKLLKYFIDGNVEAKLQNDYQYVWYSLPHDKFPSWFKIDGFEAIDITIPHIKVHMNRFEVPDCGDIVFVRKDIKCNLQIVNRLYEKQDV